ncbi:hypothetical protein N7509_001514 [Penicillium cosmopolitanum]|uniref:Uncharacterized protein n=1 Tax=Penicillium cosmopolitanum TaxID=1131564 RepID=A0A9W9W731_9EURO|nr:uncharacterized protein N7509_001514 [Penicillium cosmopolitanum]KAJ5407631.1 hypothetical protein N7509_001514 [Penicillium cosmopolitanum]
MTDLLFPTFEARLKCQRKPQYAAFLTDLVRAASDGIEALCTFRAILYDSPSEPKDGSFLAFDAHVGDTGCHLRAGMLFEAYALHREISKHRLTGKALPPIWIDETIRRLETTRTKAQHICLALTRDGARPQTLGFGGKDLVIAKGLKALEWEEVALSKGPFCLYENNQKSLQREFECLSFADSTAMSLVSSDISRPTTPSSDESEFGSPFKTEWDLYDNRVLVRLVIYCFILSKYKTFSSMNNTVAARLCPEAAAEQGYALMKDFWDFKHPEYKKARLDRIGQELRVLQVWISDLSCAWLHSIAMRCDLKEMGNLIAETARKSSTGLMVAPCYPGYLLLRREWAHGENQILLVDRYFCSLGWHFNIFVAHMGIQRDGQQFNADLQCPIEWYIQPITLDKLASSEWSSRPLPVAVGNKRAGYHTYEADECDENNQHLRDFKEADHDRLALAFFGSHKCYPFQIEPADEMEYVGLYMDILCPGMRGQWEKVANELGRRGGGKENQDIFGWQHVFIEAPKKVVDGMLDMANSEFQYTCKASSSYHSKHSA